MTIHIALVRGINVGKAKRVSMQTLRAIVEEACGRDVRTVLNSGNVVFRTRPGTRAGAGAIERSLADATGIRARVVLLHADELGAALVEDPLEKHSAEPARRLVMFFAAPAARRAAEIVAKEDFGAERIAFGAKAAHLLLPNGVAESPLMRALERAVDGSATARNWATLQKIIAVAGQLAAAPKGR